MYVTLNHKRICIMNTIKKSYIKPQTTFKASPALMAAPLAFFSAATAAAAIAGAAVGAVATSKLMSVARIQLRSATLAYAA